MRWSPWRIRAVQCAAVPSADITHTGCHPNGGSGLRGTLDPCAHLRKLGRRAPFLGSDWDNSTTLGG